MTLRCKFTMAERKPWTSAFMDAGITSREMMNMSEKQFGETCQFLIDSGIASPDLLNDDFQKAISASLEEPSKTEKKDEIQQPEEKRNAWGKPKESKGFIHLPFMRHQTRKEHQKEEAVAPPKRVLPKHTNSGTIRDEQNSEYMKCQLMALEKERKEKEEAERQAREREERANREREEEAVRVMTGERLKDALKERVRNLGPEPAQGVQIAIQMPSKRRIMRKFAKESLSDDLFLIVQADDEMFDEQYNQLEFSLTQGTGPVVKGQTFEQQGITRRTLVNVMLE